MFWACGVAWVPATQLVAWLPWGRALLSWWQRQKMRGSRRGRIGKGRIEPWAPAARKGWGALSRFYVLAVPCHLSVTLTALVVREGLLSSFSSREGWYSPKFHHPLCLQLQTIYSIPHLRLFPEKYYPALFPGISGIHSMVCLFHCLRIFQKEEACV